MEVQTKKIKLTLTIRKDLIARAKMKAKERGISVSKLFEEAIEEISNEELEKQQAMERLRELLDKSEPVQALPESDKELWHRHLDEKYG